MSKRAKMVSIRLPGMVTEMKFELPQWLPDMPDDEVKQINDPLQLEDQLKALQRKYERREAKAWDESWRPSSR